MFRCLLIGLFGAAGNLLTLLAIPWAQKKQLPGFDHTTIFIVNLALADFLYCVTVLPMYSITVSALQDLGFINLG